MTDALVSPIIEQVHPIRQRESSFSPPYSLASISLSQPTPTQRLEISKTMSSEADIRNEIARLTASINQAKTSNFSNTSYVAPAARGRGGYRGGRGYNNHYAPSSTYNAARRMNNKYIRPGLEGSSATPPTTKPDPSMSAGAGTTPVATTIPTASVASTSSSSGKATQSLVDSVTDSGLGTGAPAQESSSSTANHDGTKDVVIGGVAFESSARSLVRKDLVKPKPATKPTSAAFPYVRKAGHLVSASRSYKSKARRGRGRNMTLDNTRKSWSERMEMKKRKYLNKPCPRFTTTGTCNRGLTCMYQHDPSKIAICWNFLQGNCTNTAETCNLSHDPTPERTPLCVHFLNKGRCTRPGCMFPHVNLGKRDGVCRDFAVLGYCEKGWDCDKQHVRECPDFAENGTCSTKGCKLPHVIRANRGRKAAAASAAVAAPVDKLTTDSNAGLPSGVVTDLGPSPAEAPTVYAEDSHMGDEFISLMFHESEDEEDGDEEDDEEEEEDEEEESGEESEDQAGGDDNEDVQGRNLSPDTT